MEFELWNILFEVPQGSVLGSILFIIYASPLGDIVHKYGINFHLYADDLSIIPILCMPHSEYPTIESVPCCKIYLYSNTDLGTLIMKVLVIKPIYFPCVSINLCIISQSVVFVIWSCDEVYWILPVCVLHRG